MKRALFVIFLTIVAAVKLSDVATSVTGCIADSRIPLSDVVHTIRVSPDTEAQEVRLVDETAKIELLDGPSCSAGRLWWLVRVPMTTGTGFDKGWMSNNDVPATITAVRSRQQLYRTIRQETQESCVLDTAIGFDYGDVAHVNSRELAAHVMWVQPIIGTRVVRIVLNEDPIYVMGLPLCQNGQWWWLVRVASRQVSNDFEIGWMTAGNDSVNWIEAGAPGEVVQEDISPCRLSPCRTMILLA